MAQADSKSITKLSAMFVDPYLRSRFKAAEDDGGLGELVESDHPRHLDGGATAEPKSLKHESITICYATAAGAS
jgi:hypothetical protein